MAGPTLIRAGGFAAGVLVAGGAYGAGALPGGDPGAGLRGPGTPGVGFWLGLAAWIVGLALFTAAWWRLRGRLGEVDTRWLLVTAALWALPFLLAPPLASRDVYSYACQGDVWLSGGDPYATGAAGGGCPWAGAVPDLWRDTPAPYGPVAIALSGVAAVLARAAGDQLAVAVTVLRLVALAGGVLVAAYAGRLARATGADPGTARWLALLSPLVAVNLVSGAHNDALVAGLTVAALATALAGRAGSRAPAVAAGALLGLAVAVKVTALLALPFVALAAAAAAGRPRRWRPVAGAAGATTLGAAAAFTAASLATGLGLGWAGSLSDTGSLVQWTSVPTGVGMAAGYVLRVAGSPAAFDTAVAAGRAAGFGVLAVACLVLGWRALRAVWDGRDGAARVVVAACGAAMAAAAVLLPVFYPWYALAPVAVLACAVTARTAARLGAATVAVTALVLPNGLGLAVLTKLPGAILDVVLVAAVVAVAVQRRRRSRTRPSSREPSPATGVR